jgi:hypothetical protein
LFDEHADWKMSPYKYSSRTSLSERKGLTFTITESFPPVTEKMFLNNNQATNEQINSPFFLHHHF